MTKYSLEGVNGNSFCIMAYVKTAMKKEGKSEEEMEAYIDDARSADYDHLVVVSLNKVDELNG